MSIQPLPSTLDIATLASGKHRYEGRVGVETLSRLKVLAASTEPVEVRLVVTVSEQIETRRVGIAGEVRADLVMQCERCLGEVSVPVRGEFDLVAVDSEEAAERLPDEDSPVIAERQMLRVCNLVEDELILALPIVAMHEPQDCPGMNWQTDYEKPHPMAALAQLKSVQDK